MSIVNLIMALALMGGLWVGIVKARALSIRPSARVRAPAPLVAEAPSWRSLPANRLLGRPPACSGPANARAAVDISTMKDLSA